MPFCEPDTTTSMPHASVSIGTAPRLETASIASRHAAPAAALGDRLDVRDGRGRGLRVHDDGELQARIGHRRDHGGRVGRRPHSHSSTVTSAPKAFAIATQRSPNAPAVTHSTRSPGSIRLA